MKVLITDKVHPILIETLQANGYEVVYDVDTTMSTLPSVLPELSGLVMNSKIKMDSHMLDIGKNLKFIVRLGSGMEIIDVEYARAKGIKVINTPEGNRDAVAEHVVGMLLSLLNNLMRADFQVRNGIWRREYNRGVELKGKTLGIIGFGNTGQALAKKLSSWELNLIYHDIREFQIGELSRSVIRVSKEEILSKSDIISLHLPLTAATHHYVNEEFINNCKDGAILINTSRGKVVKTNALVKGLAQGRLGGACLDVFENEKPDTYTPEEKILYRRLFARQNIIVSPHVAGWTNESLKRISTVALKKLGFL